MGLLVPNPKLTIAQNGRLQSAFFFYPRLSVICQINTGRETVNTGKPDLCLRSPKLRFLALSATVMWAEYHDFFCGARTLQLLFSGVWSCQTHSRKSWGISGEQPGLQPKEVTPVYTWQQRLVLFLLRICRYSHNICISQIKEQDTNKDTKTS